jgi:prophage regulatory protein
LSNLPKLYRHLAQMAIIASALPADPRSKKIAGVVYINSFHLTEFMTCFTHMTRDLHFMWSVEADVGHLLEPELNPQTKRSTMPSALSRKLAVANLYREKIVQQPQTSQFKPRKLPASQRPEELTLNGALSHLDDVAFLRLPEVKAITGLSKSSLYALIKEKNFPAPVRLGARAVAWVRSEVRQWAAERVHASRSVA